MEQYGPGDCGKFGILERLCRLGFLFPDRAEDFSEKKVSLAIPITGGSRGRRFSFVSFGRGSSWSTTTGLIGDVCVTIFTILYPTSDSTSIHAGIHLLNSCVNTRSLQQDILSLHVAETTGPHQPFSRLEIATAKYVDRRRKFHSDVRRQVNYK